MECIIDANLQSMIKKIDNCKNNPEKSSTTKIGEHIPCGYSMSTIWTFDSITNKLSLYRGEEYVKKFFISLREHEADVIKLRKEKKLVSVHKKIAKLTSRFNGMLHLEKKTVFL